MGIFKIEQAVTALSAAAFLQIFEEGVVSRVARSDDFDIYLSFVFDVEDHISVLFVFLYLFVRCLANVCDCYSGCLVKNIDGHKLLGGEKSEMGDYSGF